MREAQRPQAASGRFEDLDFVFAQTVTTVLTAEQERSLIETVWQSRRRLALANLWSDNPDLFFGLPPTPAPHRMPLSTGFVRRLIDAEKKAIGIVAGTSSAGALTNLMKAELDAIALARQTLFEHNLRLVVWVARAFLGKGLELADLFQEGSIVLLRSIDRYDPARGTRLSTFASHSIRLGLVRALTERGRPIRVPSYRMREVIDTTKARGQLVSRLGREPTALELEAETGLEAGTIDEILPAIRPLSSLDAPIAGSSISLSEVLSTSAGSSPYDALVETETVEQTWFALSRLPSREQRVLSMRYGLEGTEEHTYEDIGRTLGLSRERVRQLEKSARGKMRTWLVAS